MKKKNGKILKENRFIVDALGIKLRHNNFDYKTKLPKRRMDCSTRTISRLLNMSYDDVLKLQFKITYEYGILYPNYDNTTKDILTSYGYKRIPMVTTHQSIAQFMYEHKEGRYAIAAGRHILAYINGVWYDDNQNLIAPDLYIVQKVAYVYEYCGE